MASCELCGKNPSVYDCEIEGTVMKVCQDCSRFGRVKGKSNVRILVEDNRKVAPKEPEYVFVQGYGLMIKNARERQGLKQEDFAKRINEHKSLIHQVESEHIKPSIDFARKLERALHIKIVEEVKQESSDKEDQHPMDRKDSRNDKGFSVKSGPMTLGDMIGMRKK